MNVAFIPVRGGSKSIPLKNIKTICGKPLVYWTVMAACNSKYIDKVYVATDSNIIKKTVESFKTEIGTKLFTKLEVIGRSEKSATDTASTEIAMLEFAEKYSFDNIALIQATSPLLESSDLDNGFKVFSEEGVDSVLSVVKQKRFNWQMNKDGYAYAMNYDLFHRPRRQEFDGYYVENGAFYICSREGLLKTKNRIFGNIKVVEMSEENYFEIDEPNDWIIIEDIMKKKGINVDIYIPEIKIFITDCDGCLTDGGMYYSERGDEQKKFNTRDGMGFSLIKDEGIITGIITSENVDLNRRRAEKLNLDEFIPGSKNKLAVITDLCMKYHCELENVAYIGDDINDIDSLKHVGFGCCPADAIDEVKGVVKYISTKKGGEGCIREIVEMIIKRKNEF